MENDKGLDMEIMDRITPFSGPVPKAESGMDALAAGVSMQRVQTPYTTAVAVQRPRKISIVAQNVYEEAELAGKSFYYGWDVTDRKSGKKTRVEGPSIDLAMCIARNYGNSAIDIQAEETPTHYMIKGVFIDLETGFTAPRLFRQRKSQSMGEGMNAERQEDIVFQIGQSKAIRNAIIKTMPAWLIEKAIEKAKSMEGRNVINLKSSIAEAITYFSEKDISKERLEAYIGRESDAWLKSDIVNLKGVATALQEGRVSAHDVFPEVSKMATGTGPVPEEKPAANTAPAYEKSKAATTTKAPAEPAAEKPAPVQSTSNEDAPPFENGTEKKSQAAQNKAQAETKGRAYTATSGPEKKPEKPAPSNDAETRSFLKAVRDIQKEMPVHEFKAVLDFYAVDIPEHIKGTDNQVSFIKDCMSVIKRLGEQDQAPSVTQPQAPAPDQVKDQTSARHGFVTCPMTKESFTKSTCDMTMCDRRETCPEYKK